MRDKKKILQILRDKGHLKESDFEKEYTQALEEEAKNIAQKDQTIKKLKSNLIRKGIPFTPPSISPEDIL